MKPLVTVLLVILCGCGGGSVANQQPPAPPPTVAPPPLPQHYQATDLPPISGLNAAQANAINSQGHAVGYSVLNGVAHGTLWKDGRVIDLGPNTLANAINDSDQIVGYRKDAQGLTHAYLWPDMADLGSLAGYDSAIATGINKSGTVVGVAYNSTDTSHQAAFQWTQATGMQVVPGCLNAEAINDKGQIVGIGTNFDAAICGGEDMGIAGAAVAINNLGQAVGYSNDHAYVFPSTDLGPQSLATGINDYGWVIGMQFTQPASTSVRRLLQNVALTLFGKAHPFVWSRQTGIIMLSGAVTVSGINQKGQISGAAVVGEEIQRYMECC